MYVITGSSGALFGRPVLGQLRRLAPGARIVAGTRDPGSAAELAATGAEVRRVDFDDPGSLAPAFAGATAVLVNGTNYGTPAGRRGAQHAAAIRAAADAGAARVVYVSWPDPELYPLPLMADFAGSEALLRELSPGATILRTTYGVAQAVGRDVAGAVASGVLTAPAGRARTTPAHIDDLAEATARVLTSDEHGGRLYTLTAADSIGWDDLAGLAATISGKPVRYQPAGDDEFTSAAAAQGMPAELAGVLLGVYHAFRAGWTGTPTGDLATLLGRAPRPALDAVAAVTGG